MSSRDNSMDRIRTSFSYKLDIDDSKDLVTSPVYDTYMKYSSRTSVNQLPSLPHSQTSFPSSPLSGHMENAADDSDNGNTYVEFDLSSLSQKIELVNR